jgi:rhodanese-related sulfurtransferase
LDGVTPPLAGIEGAGRIAFLAYDSIGSLLWSALYAGLGYVFADSLEVIVVSMSKLGNGLVWVIGVPLVCYVCWRIWIIAHMLRHLRLRRIAPLLLHKKLASGEQVAIIDLLSFEEKNENRAGIPGAVRMDPARLRNRFRVEIPKNVGIVLYCSSAGEFTSARVAVALQKKGVSNVWVLDGGLTAWKNEGLPLTLHLSYSK